MANDELFCRYHISATEKWLESHEAPPEMIAHSVAVWEEVGGRQLSRTDYPVELAPHFDETTSGTSSGILVRAKFPYPPWTVVGKLHLEDMPGDIRYMDIVSKPIF